MRRIRDVERRHLSLQSVSLTERKCSCQSRVVIDVMRTAQAIAPDITESSRLGIYKNAPVEILLSASETTQNTYRTDLVRSVEISAARNRTRRR